MIISCVIDANELLGMPSDIIVFPERVALGELKKAQASHPNAIIVGAVVDKGRYCRGVILHKSRNRIAYLKVLSDGHTKGSEYLQQNPVYHNADVCIGMVICKDVDQGEFTRAVVDKIRGSTAQWKILCIPANMHSDWFQADTLPFPQRFAGVYVVLCNHKDYPQRCKSFIADTRGAKIRIQNGIEPIRADLA
jgi:hypothetical protein